MILLFLIAFINYGCGRKGLPSIPKEAEPLQIKDIKAEAKEGMVRLSFKMPKKKGEEQIAAEPKEFAVYRLSEEEEKEIKKRDRFDKVGSIYLSEKQDISQEIKFEDKRNLFREKWYHYVVACFDKADKLYAISDTVDVFFSIEPEAPKNLRAETKENYITLQWNPPAVDIEGNPVKSIAGYNVYRKNIKEKSYRAINKSLIKNEKYTDIELEQDEEYFYFVRAVDNHYPPWHESADSNTLEIENRDMTAPEAPKNLFVIGGIGRISLSWDKNVEPDFAGYRIYRSTVSGKDYKLLTEEIVREESFEDISVASGINYFYAITAIDNSKNANESSFSKEESSIAQ